MRTSDYISTIEKIKPDKDLREKICALQGNTEFIENTKNTGNTKFAGNTKITKIEKVAKPARLKTNGQSAPSRKRPLKLYWILIPAAAILVLLFGGGMISRMLAPSDSGTPDPGNPVNSTLVLQPGEQLRVEPFSISVYAADGAMTDMVENCTSLDEYQDDELPGIPFLMDSSLFEDSLIYVTADKGQILYSSGSDYVAYAAGIQSTVKQGGVFYWSAGEEDIDSAKITITEEKDGVFCSYIRMALTSDTAGVYSAEIETVLTAPVKSDGTLSVSGKINDGVGLDAVIDPVSAEFYFKPDAAGKKYVTHIIDWSKEDRFVSAFSNELAGAAITEQIEKKADPEFALSFLIDENGESKSVWSSVGESPSFSYTYENGDEIILDFLMCNWATYYADEYNEDDYYERYRFNEAERSQTQKDSLASELPFASRDEALAAVRKKLDLLQLSVSSDYSCYAYSGEQFPGSADYYFIEFHQEFSGLPVIHPNYQAEVAFGEYVFSDYSHEPVISAIYSKDGIVNFRIHSIYEDESSDACTVSDCEVPDIIRAYETFEKLNGSYTVTEVKLAYLGTEFSFTPSDFTSTFEPCWAFRIIEDHMENDEGYNERGIPQWYYVPYSMVGES